MRLVLCLICMLLTACQFVGVPYQVVASEVSERQFASSGDVTATDAFTVYQASPRDEVAKIQFLLNIVRYSEYRFMRNGSIYDANDAGRFLEMKYQHHYANIKTAEQFIRDIATFSSTSGKAYYMVLAEGELVPLSDVLSHELKRLTEIESESRLVTDETPS